MNNIVSNISFQLITELARVKYVPKGYLENGIEHVATQLGIMPTEEEKKQIKSKVQEAFVELSRICENN